MHCQVHKTWYGLPTLDVCVWCDVFEFKAELNRVPKRKSRTTKHIAKIIAKIIATDLACIKCVQEVELSRGESNKQTSKN